jgi:hypothetical protein
MGASNSLLNRQIITAVGNNMTGVAAVVSDPIDTWQFNQVCIELQITGTPTGVLTIEGSNQYDPIKNPSATFVPLPASAMLPSLPAVAGAALSYIGSANTGARWIRWRYVNSASTGVLNAWENATGA